MNRTKVDVDIPIDKDFSKTKNYSVTSMLVTDVGDQMCW